MTSSTRSRYRGNGLQSRDSGRIRLGPDPSARTCGFRSSLSAPAPATRQTAPLSGTCQNTTATRRRLGLPTRRPLGLVLAHESDRGLQGRPLATTRPTTRRHASCRLRTSDMKPGSISLRTTPQSATFLAADKHARAGWSSQVLQRRVVVVRRLDLVEERGPDNASALPDSRTLSQVNSPRELVRSRADKIHPLRIAADL